MNFKEIKEIIEIFTKSPLAKMQIRNENFEIKLDKTAQNDAPKLSMPLPAPVTTAAPEPMNISPVPQKISPDPKNEFIVSPMVGIFYHRSSPTAAPYVKTGDVIKKGQVVGIVEAMKIMNEIEADFDCKIEAIEVDDAQAVEFGSQLIRVSRV